MQTVETAGVPIGPSHPPRIMGVLNLSSESPYDPSVFTDPDAAATYVDEQLIDEGADIVDIGLESANKRFDVLPPEAELDRLDRALDVIDRVDGDAVFSLETRYASVAEAGLEGGFDMINDICGFADAEMPNVCESQGAVAVKMAGPGSLERPGAVETVDGIYEALAADPLPPGTIVDPAFGGWSTGKTEAVDRETFRRLREFQALDRPILVSINRKNFLRNVADRSTEGALPVSLAATSMAVERGAHVIRTHDVAATRDAALIGAAFRRDRLRDPDFGVYELEVTNTQELRRHLARIGAGEAAAADRSGYAFELRDLDPVDRELLGHASADYEGRFLRGNDLTGGVLLGTRRSIEQLGETVRSESPQLEAIFDRLVDHLAAGPT